MRARVDGKVAIVTGGSRGIGAATAASLLESGAAGVVITGRKRQALEEAAERLGADRVLPVVGNVADDAHAADAVGQAIDRFGSLDLLVNNAGTNPTVGLLVDVDLATVDKTWQVNQRAPLVWVREAWRQWMSEHGGAVVNVGSLAGLEPAAAMGAYCVSKAALHHLTRQLALELAPAVRVNAVAAAIIETSFSKLLYAGRKEEAAGSHPLGRLGTPEDVASAIVFLLSDAASWLTGVVLPVDGGASGAKGWMGIETEGEPTPRFAPVLSEPQ